MEAPCCYVSSLNHKHRETINKINGITSQTSFTKHEYILSSSSLKEGPYYVLKDRRLTGYYDESFSLECLTDRHTLN